MKPLLLRLHRWITLVFAIPLAVLIVTGLILSVEPIMQDAATRGLSLPAARVVAALDKHDPEGKARGLQIRAYENRLVLQGVGADGSLDLDLKTGEAVDDNARTMPSDIFSTAKGLHEHFIYDLRWVVTASTIAMVVLIVIGVFMGWPRIRNTMSGWHQGMAWFGLPILALSPITGLMLAYGASFDLTPREKGMKGAIERALELIDQTPGSWMPQQFENPANIDVHVRTTAEEILADFADTPIDVLVSGVGTGGHITGTAQVLKQVWPKLKVYAVEPTLSPVISGGQPGPHPIQGIGAGFIPANLHTQLLDGVIQVDPADAKDYARRAAREEGLLVGISSGATLAAIAQKLKELPAGSRVLGFNYDTGERYLSVPDFLPE